MKMSSPIINPSKARLAAISKEVAGEPAWRCNYKNKIVIAFRRDNQFLVRDYKGEESIVSMEELSFFHHL